MKFLKCMLALLFASCLSVLSVNEIRAADDDIQTCDIIECNETNQFKVVSKTKKSNTYGSYSTLAENTKGASNNGETLGATKTFTYGNSISGAVSASYSTISSSLGFNVTKSYSVSTSYSIPLKKGQKGRITVRPVYENYQVGVQRWYSGTIGCNRWGATKTANVKKYSHPDYASTVWY